MEITHEEARKLIQFNADEALNVQEKVILSAHLKECTACRAYAEEISEVEGTLLPVMKKHWNLQPNPLSIGAIAAKRNSSIQTVIILATRTAAIGVVLLAFVFSAWQLARSGGQETSGLPIGLPPVPTPSIQFTSTKSTAQSCAGILYVVKENDTLESIAHQFSISKQEIMAVNNMESGAVNTAMELTIPICSFTPTGTINPTILGTRYTPSTSPTTSTPGSSG
jgi:LysM domain-containing protein